MKNKSAHHMLIALRRILQEDCNSIRDKDFKEIADRTPIINFVYKTHAMLRPSWISSLMVAGYGFKSLLALSVRKNPEQQILFTYAFPNEVSVGEFISKCFNRPIVSTVYHSNRLLFSFRSLVLILSSLVKVKSLIRYLKISHRINRNYTFMPACRTLSTICFYMRFQAELKKNPFSAVLISKSYSPDCIALVWAAKSLGIPTIFCSHSFLPPVQMSKPPLSFTLLILQSERMYEILKGRGAVQGKVIYKGIEGEYSALVLSPLKQQGMRVGVFLSGSLNVNGIREQVLQIQKELSPSQILIRLHPVALASANINSLKSEYKNVILTFGTAIKQDLDSCDLVIVGNSGVVLEVLKLGKPCVYVSTLEDIDFDYNGFVASEIIPYWPKNDRLDVNKIKEFYSGSWKDRFKKYDPFYGETIGSEDLIREEISRLI